MVNEAEKYKDEDDKQRDRVQAKNGLESYTFHLKSTIDDDKVKNQISKADRDKIEKKCNETLSWLESNQVSTQISLCLYMLR